MDEGKKLEIALNEIAERFVNRFIEAYRGIDDVPSVLEKELQATFKQDVSRLERGINIIKIVRLRYLSQRIEKLIGDEKSFKRFKPNFECMKNIESAIDMFLNSTPDPSLIAMTSLALRTYATQLEQLSDELMAIYFPKSFKKIRGIFKKKPSF